LEKQVPCALCSGLRPRHGAEIIRAMKKAHFALGALCGVLVFNWLYHLARVFHARAPACFDVWHRKFDVGRFPFSPPQPRL
jgi:hypothetical protein